MPWERALREIYFKDVSVNERKENSVKHELFNSSTNNEINEYHLWLQNKAFRLTNHNLQCYKLSRYGKNQTQSN